ncbi:hypothetical protein TI03_06290, partial [Achromatium sp. WMS1]
MIELYKCYTIKHEIIIIRQNPLEPSIILGYVIILILIIADSCLFGRVFLFSNKFKIVTISSIGKLLYFTLEPVQVEVKVDVTLLSEAPKADILIIRRSTPHWTEKQRQWLADGLRHADASDLLI